MFDKRSLINLIADQIFMFLNDIMLLVNFVSLHLVFLIKNTCISLLIDCNSEFCDICTVTSCFVNVCHWWVGETGNPSLLFHELSGIIHAHSAVVMQLFIVLNGANLGVRRVFCVYAIPLNGVVCSPPSEWEHSYSVVSQFFILLNSFLYRSVEKGGCIILMFLYYFLI